MTKMYNPGEDNKPAGKYLEVGPRGGTVKGSVLLILIRVSRYPQHPNPEITGKKLIDSK